MREKRPVWFCITVGLLLCSAGYAAYVLHGYDTERFWLSVVLLFVSAVLFLISFFLFSGFYSSFSLSANPFAFLFFLFVKPVIQHVHSLLVFHFPQVLLKTLWKK